MKNNLKISIILPVLNEAGMAEMTVLSLLHNTDYNNYEIILVDQGSDDGCCDFLQREEFKHYTNIRYINADYSNGVAMTKNIGAKNAFGDIFIFADCHMGFRSGWVDIFLNELYKDDNIGIITCSLPNLLQYPKKNIGNNTFHLYTIENYKLGSLWRINSNMIAQETPNAPGGFMVVRKDAFNYTEGFDEDMRMWGYEDLEFSMRMWLCGYKIIAIPYLNIYHMYRTAFHNYTIPPENVTYNFCRFAITCFNERRQKDILNEGKNKIGFIESITELINDERFWDRKKRLEKKFKYNDQWYFNKFKNIYLFDKYVNRDISCEIEVDILDAQINNDIMNNNVLFNTDVNIFIENWSPIVDLGNNIACFIGYNSRYLFDKISVKYGYYIDRSNFYNVSNNNIKFIETDLISINLANNSVSAIFIIDFLKYTKNIKKYLMEMSRILNYKCYLYLAFKVDGGRSDIHVRYMPQDIKRELNSVGLKFNRENYYYKDNVLYYTLILQK